MSTEQIAGLTFWAVWVAEVARQLFYVMGALFLVALIAWFLYGGNNERWPIGDAVSFVFCVAFLLAILAAVVILFAYKPNR